MKTLAYVVVTGNDIILPYTVDSIKEQCEEKAKKFFSDKAWEKLKELGAKIVQCEIILTE